MTDNSKKYAKFDYHGGPYDRGAADSYYRRGQSPHKYPQGTGQGTRIELSDPEEIAAYIAGYEDNEEMGNYKDW